MKERTKKVKEIFYYSLERIRHYAPHALQQYSRTAEARLEPAWQRFDHIQLSPMGRKWPAIRRSLRALKRISSLTLEAKSARAPLTPRDPPRSALTTTNWKRATGGRATISRTPVSARGCCRSCPPVPNRRTVRAGDRPGCRPTPRHGSRVGGTVRAPGRLQWLAEAWVGGPFAAPRARRSTRERERGQHMRTRRIGGRVRRARGQHPKVSATRNWYDAPLTRPKVGRSLRERRPNRR